MKNLWMIKLGLILLVIVSTILFAASATGLIYGVYDDMYKSNKTFFGSLLCEGVADTYEEDFLDYYNLIIGYDNNISGESAEVRLKRYEKMFSKENCNVSISLMRADEVIFSNFELEKYSYESKYLSNLTYPRVTIVMRIAPDVHPGDMIYTYYKLWSFLHDYSFLVITALIASLAAMIYGFCKLCKLAGGKGRLSLFDRIPFLITSGVFVGSIGIIIYICQVLCVGLSYRTMDAKAPLYILGAVILTSVIVSALLMLYFTSISRRAKLKMLFKTTLLYYVFTFLRYLFNLGVKLTENVPGVLKSIALVVLLVLGDILLAIASDGEITLFVFLIHVIFLLVLLYFLLCLGAIKKKLQSFSKGDFTKKLDGDNMFGALKRCVDDINSISDGVQAEVVRRMKSERMKTELITNVSHDIKTPLTSIINYVDLLKKEELENETAKEYIEVLDRQSQRLKKLTDDLVEASKAQTGCLTLNRTPIDISELLKQVVGEYSERLSEKELNPIVEDDTGGVTLNADGRLMWRVLDNLFSNVCKYSLEGTRVYIGMKKIDEMCEISITNYSKYPLSTIDEAELFERFVRGDASRNTEGSGLGLSIARSLVELHEGNMELKIDSDLFKIKIMLPLV